MDGFFDKYGRVIIVAVVICFVLLFLTPMRNVVGSSINGFAENFANKVGDSLGTVKMPDGSGGATNSEKVKVGDTLDIEGTKYIVLEERENNQALIMTASSIGKKVFNSINNPNYKGSTIDNYLENEWYDSLSSTMKAAIQPTNIKQSSYAINDPDFKQETEDNDISRHVFLPSVSEIGKVVDLKNSDKVKAFLNGTSVWTRDRLQSGMPQVEYLSTSGGLNANPVDFSLGVRPTFVIDLSKVDYKVTSHTDYK